MDKEHNPHKDMLLGIILGVLIGYYINILPVKEGFFIILLINLLTTICIVTIYLTTYKSLYKYIDRITTFFEILLEKRSKYIINIKDDINIIIFILIIFSITISVLNITNNLLLLDTKQGNSNNIINEELIYDSLSNKLNSTLIAFNNQQIGFLDEIKRKQDTIIINKNIENNILEEYILKLEKISAILKNIKFELDSLKLNSDEKAK